VQFTEEFKRSGVILVTVAATEMTYFEAARFQASVFSQSDPPAPPVRSLAILADQIRDRPPAGVQCIQKELETGQAEARQFAPHQVGGFCSSNPEDVSHTTLRPTLVLHDCTNHAPEFRLRQQLTGIGQCQVFEDVPTTRFDLEGHVLRAIGSRHH